MPEKFYAVPESTHNTLVEAAYLKRGYSMDEVIHAVRVAANASRHGIRTHNAIKALHLDLHYGSGAGGCTPGAVIEKKSSRFAAAEIWNCNQKLGQAVASEAMEKCIELTEKYGVGLVSVDNAFHYLWGGCYVMEAAKKGYIAYTNCTAALAEVVPFKGVTATLGTNPHSWGFPTTEVIGFPLVIDWATSVISTGKVQQLNREGLPLPPNAAVDSEGNVTTDPSQVAAMLPFGEHKGYALCLMDELIAALIGGSLPTLRGRWTDDDEKHTPCFFFQVIHPDALNAGAFARSRTQTENVKAVFDDIFGHGNEDCMFPGQLEDEAAQRSEKHGGLLFSENEIHAFNKIANECGQPPWKIADFKVAE